MRLDESERGFLQTAVRHALREAFRDAIETAGDDVPRLSSANLHISVPCHRPTAVLRVRFSHNRRYRREIAIPWDVVRGQRIRDETIDLTWEASRQFSQALEDHYVERENRQLRQVLLNAQRSGAPREQIERIAYDLAHREQHARAYHHSSRGGVAPQNTYWIDEADTLQGVVYPDGYTRGGRVGSQEAEARGLQLLKDNLTPQQLADYEKHSYFDVKGGTSGKTYRIKHGRQMNINELDDEGKSVCGWCFLPQGGLVVGDIMLAQKNALELYEEKALRIANKFGVGAGGGMANFADAMREVMSLYRDQLAENILRSNPLLRLILQEAQEARQEMVEAVYGRTGPSGPGGLGELIADMPAPGTVGGIDLDVAPVNVRAPAPAGRIVDLDPAVS